MQDCTLLNTKQAAAYLGIAFRTMERWRCEGTGPRFRKVGRVVRYLKEDLEAYLDRQARNSTSQDVKAA